MIVNTYIPEMMDTIESVLVCLFLGALALGMYLIIYFNILRYKGIITTGYQITAGSFDYELTRTKDEQKIRQLTYCRKVYFIFLYTATVTLIALAAFYIWSDR